MTITEDIGKQASIDGFAHEHIVAGILMKKYQNVSRVDLPLSPYDLIIVQKLPEENENIIRAQVKTAKRSVRFTGGSRGGVDREYKSDIKTYVQSPKTSDVIIGIHPNPDRSFDLYFIPTILIQYFGTKSKSLGAIDVLKDNYYFLERCKDQDFIITKSLEYGII